MCLDASQDRGFRRINNGIARYSLHNTPTRCKPASPGGRGHVDGSVATGILKISPDFICKNPPKTDKKNKYKHSDVKHSNDHFVDVNAV